MMKIALKLFSKNVKRSVENQWEILHCYKSNQNRYPQKLSLLYHNCISILCKSLRVLLSLKSKFKNIRLKRMQIKLNMNLPLPQLLNQYRNLRPLNTQTRNLTFSYQIQQLLSVPDLSIQIWGLTRPWNHWIAQNFQMKIAHHNTHYSQK